MVDNIPSSILDGAYHLGVGQIKITPLGVNGVAFNFIYPVTLRVLSKGFKDPGAAIDAALDNAQNILEAVLGASIDSVGLKHVHPVGLTTQPFQLSNEHAVILTMNFNADLVLSF